MLVTATREEENIAETLTLVVQLGVVFGSGRRALRSFSQTGRLLLEIVT